MVPKLQPSIHKSVKQFGYSFAFDDPTIGNALPDEIRVPPFPSLFQEAAENLPVLLGMPTLVPLTPWHSLLCLASLLFLDTEIG